MEMGFDFMPLGSLSMLVVERLPIQILHVRIGVLPGNLRLPRLSQSCQGFAAARREGPPGAGSKESGAYPQGARDPAPAAAAQRLLNFFDLAVQLNDAMQRKAARLRDGIHFSANQIHVRLQLLSHVGIAVLRRFVSRSPAAVSASPA